MKMTKEEFVTRLLYDLNERKKQQSEIEKDVDFYFRRKITKYMRRKLNKKH